MNACGHLYGMEPLLMPLATPVLKVSAVNEVHCKPSWWRAGKSNIIILAVPHYFIQPCVVTPYYFTTVAAGCWIWLALPQVSESSYNGKTGSNEQVEVITAWNKPTQKSAMELLTLPIIADFVLSFVCNFCVSKWTPQGLQVLELGWSTSLHTDRKQRQVNVELDRR